MKKATIFQLAVGVVLIGLSITVMLGWLTKLVALTRIGSASVGMVFNTALSFFAIGVAFMWPATAGRTYRLRTIIGWGLIVFVGTISFQYLANVDLPIDWKSLHEWLDDTNPKPGRIAMNTCIGLILCGVAFILNARTPNRMNSIAIHFAILGVLLMGLSGLIGHALRVDLIYPSLHWPRMALQTAAALILTASGLWTLWYNTNRSHRRYRFPKDEKIAFIGAAYLAATALTVGLAGFAAQVATLERVISDKLWPILENRDTVFKANIKYHLDSAQHAGNQNKVIRLLKTYAAHPHTAAGRPGPQALENMQSFLQLGFSGIAIRDKQGRQLLGVGSFVENPAIKIDLGIETSAVLLWENGYYLKNRLELFDNGVWIGTFDSEQPLPELTDTFFTIGYLGETGEIGMCFAQDAARLSCFPQLRRPFPYQLNFPGKNGKQTAMALAVSGKAGVFSGQDYRGENIVAAYKPVARGLGLVVKQDTRELLAPVRKQMAWSLPLFFLLVGAGAFILRAQIKPIGARLLHSEADAKKKEQHIRAVIDNVAEGIITIDANSRIETINDSASAIFGYASEELIGKNIRILLPREMRVPQVRDVQGWLRQAVLKKNNEVFGRRKDKTQFPLEFSISELSSGEQCLFVLIVRDIQRRKQAESAIFEEKERLHVTLCSIGDAVITTDTAGCITYLNPIAENMTGWTNEEAAGFTLPQVFQVINEITGEPASNSVTLALENGQSTNLAKNTTLIGRSGECFAIEDTAAPIRARSGTVIGAVLVFRDVGESRKIAAHMHYQATHDALTGLINRHEFEQRLDVSLERAKSEHQENTLLYLDLDRFKVVNDTCGHLAGDELLRQLSGLLSASIRQSDTLARLGGDEFCVLLEHCETEKATRIAEKLIQVVGDFRFVWQDKAFPIGVSIGLVCFGEKNLTSSEVFQMADAACYAAKDRGRNRIQVYMQDDRLLAQRRREVGWLERIRTALDEDRFVLYAQKIMPLKQPSDGAESEGAHFELLIRMVEDGKLIPPMAFIPTAERYGIMPALDRWVIRAAFADYMERVEKNKLPCTYAINLSGASIGDEDFLNFVLAQFESCEVPPHKICFEITETSAIANLNHAAALIRQLKAIGCRFSLDDFGSGMSSFAYLKHLPVDYLKIDGGFVKNMVDDPIDHAMVESVNHIGHVMGIKTIAEFVGNDAILKALQKIGVDYGQGYGIAEPLPLHSIVI
jgi:diguanylate cyclase (GGDEF)-like protein/PAS domain S-box-containing protein